MSTPNSSVPYRYPTTQAQDPRLHQQPYQPYQQPSASTSTSSASAYAYAQQQQQASRQSQTHTASSSSTSTYSVYVPSPINKQTISQPKRPSPLADRPHSIEELAKIAGIDKYDRFGDVKQDLRFAEIYLTQGKKDYEGADLEWAFIHFARAATLVLNRIPTNVHYNEMKESHRKTLADNGNFCLERMSEIKPKLVDRYELWRRRHPQVKPELDMARILNTMMVRDNEEFAIRSQNNKAKRAASKEEATKRAQAEEEKQKLAERAEEAARQQVYDAAAKKVYDEARRKQEEVQKREADEIRRREDEARQREADERRKEEETRRREAEEARKRALEEQRRRDIEEEARRREADEALRREAEERGRLAIETEQRQKRAAEEENRRREAQRREQALREESRRKAEEMELRRRREQEGIAQRQREAETEARSTRSMLNVNVPKPALKPPPPPPPSDASSSGSSASGLTMTPRQSDGLPVLPLESPTRPDSTDPRSGRHHPQPQHATPERAIGRSNVFQPPITTTSPPPRDRIASPISEMTIHQRMQGYTPSLQSMFSVPITGPPTGLLFSPNHPEGPSAKNMPTSPERPPAHVRHLWEAAGYKYNNYPEKPKPLPAPGDARILRPEQVGDEAVTFFKQTELKIVKVPQDIIPRFLNVAAVNTARNKETCGLLMGREDGKEYRVVTLLIPKQRSTSDTCTMEEEELVSDFAEKRKMMTLGWIHTHPTQTCFMSSMDLHTHASFQSMLPEFFAVVCSPQHLPNCGVFRLTDPPGLKTILKCTQGSGFHSHQEAPIYTDADKGHVVWAEDAVLEIVDLR